MTKTPVWTSPLKQWGNFISILQMENWKRGFKLLALDSEGKISASLTTTTITIWTAVDPLEINNRNSAFQLLSDHLIRSNLWTWRWKVNPPGHLLSFTFLSEYLLPCLACPLLAYISCCLVMLVYLWFCGEDCSLQTAAAHLELLMSFL